MNQAWNGGIGTGKGAVGCSTVVLPVDINVPNNYVAYLHIFSAESDFRLVVHDAHR